MSVALASSQDTKPIFIRESYKGADKLKGKVALITGGDGCNHDKDTVRLYDATADGSNTCNTQCHSQ
jgi:hypothetical protein